MYGPFSDLLEVCIYFFLVIVVRWMVMLFAVISRHQKGGKEDSGTFASKKIKEGGTSGTSANTHQGGQGATTKEGVKEEDNTQEDVRSVISLHHY